MVLSLQALSRDIRSVTQRVKVPAKAAQGQGALTLQGGGSHSHRMPSIVASHAEELGPGAKRREDIDVIEGKWHVVLNGVEITYDVEPGRGTVGDSVVLKTACLAS